MRHGKQAAFRFNPAVALLCLAARALHPILVPPPPPAVSSSSSLYLLPLGAWASRPRSSLLAPLLLAAGLLLLLGPGVALAADPIAFAAADAYTVASAPFRMASGDLDGDGDLDIVVAHDTSKYSVLLNNGAGGFTATSYTAGSRLRDVAIAFINLDSIPDVAFTDWSSNLVRTFIGVGDGTFTAGATYATASGADGIVTADFNADGRDDVAACARNASSVSVFLGQAGGGLSAKTDFDAGGSCMELAAGQVNAGPELDLVTANYASDNIGVLLGNGAGGFGAVTTIAAGNDNYDLALGDLNSDGKLDVALGSGANDNIRLLLGDGLGGFVQTKVLTGCNGPHQVRIADLNGGGYPDVLAACKDGAPGLAIWLQHGYLNFTAVRNYHADNAANGLTVANFDGQTLPDIATAQANNTIRVLKQLPVDTDGDLLADADETIIGTNPADPDSDADLMPDDWEVSNWCVDPFTPDASADGDDDLIANLAEFQAATVPCDMTDTDGDLMPNGWEALYGCMQGATADATADYDSDGRVNLDEYRYRSMPCDPGDIDGDGMPNVWENAYPCMNPTVRDSSLDYDADLLTNLQEYQRSNDPCVFTDSDSDLMPDGWEELYASCGLNKLVPDANLDPDKDTLTNLQEYLEGTNPCVPNDTDTDGMPDWWENAHFCMDPNLYDAFLDYDNDSYSNLYEYNYGGDPCFTADSDGDGMPDEWETIYYCVNPLVGDSTLDPDGDQFDNLAEYLVNTNPCAPNDDGDGMPEAWEIAHPCLNPAINDAGLDPDADLLSNLEEYQYSTDPCVYTDSDADGMPDGWENDYGCVNRLVADAGDDPDADTLTNLQEYLAVKNPCVQNDSDFDGMPDHWEDDYPCMQPNLPDAGLDYDEDYYSNLAEFNNSTNPCVFTESDSDLMPDGWEDLYTSCGLNKLVNDGDLDPDDDTFTNLQEYQADKNPCVVNDTDGDGMPDHWEDDYPCLNPAINDAELDPDSDYLSNLNEFRGATNPCVFNDSDFDLMPDGWEQNLTCISPFVADAHLDPDSDGVDNLHEFGLLTDPCVSNSPWPPIVLSPYTNFPVAAEPVRMATSDLNADGFIDIVVAHDTEYSVLINNGAGVFTTTSITNGFQFIDVVVAFINTDSIPDLVFSDHATNMVWTFMGLGDGTFVGSINYPTADGAWGIVKADFNRDGRDDIAVCAYGAKSVSVFFGQVGGGLSDKTDFPVGLDCYDLAVGQVNAGPELDIVSSGSRKISVLLGDGAGGFNPAITTDTGWNSNPRSIALGDLNEDGKLDLAVGSGGNYNEVYIFLGDGQGSFTNVKTLTGCYAPSQVIITDFNVNGHLDVVASCEGRGPGLAIWLQHGFMNFNPVLLYAWTFFAHDLAIANFDTQSLPDVVTAPHYYSKVRVFRQRPIDSDGDLLADPEEILEGTGVGNPDTDGDGLPDGYEVGLWCIDPINPDANADGDGDLITNLAECQAATVPCDMTDSDADGMPDGWELLYPCMLVNTPDADADYDSDGFLNRDEYLYRSSPCIPVDTDGDSLSDVSEINLYFTNPNDPDSDDDGLSDGAEVLTYGTSPTGWDSDGDFQPDGYEVANMAGHDPGQNLNPLNNADGPADFDGDGNPNVHEFWNGTDPWAADPVPDGFQNPACYYWAEGDGDGVPGPGDVAIMKDTVANGVSAYANVLPRGVFDTQDIDKDGAPGPGDVSSVQEMVTGVDRPSGYPSTPTSLLVVSAPGGAVAVGDTCHVTIEVVNQALAILRSGAMAVVFSIDPSSTGSAVILGGDGEDLGQAGANRYDVSGLSTAGGRANIVLKVTAPGTIILNAKVPACGTGTHGRWFQEVVLSPAVSIIAE